MRFHKVLIRPDLTPGLILIFMVYLQAFPIYAQDKASDGIKTFRLLLHDNFDRKAFRDSLLQSSIPINERPALIIGRCKAACKPYQEALLLKIRQFEQDHPNEFSRVTFHFLVNLAVVQGTDELKQYLLQLGLIKEVIDDNFSPFLIPPVERIASISRQVGAREPGLGAIGAPFLWQKGYTGAGRLIYTIDTGVWTNHPAISRQWSGNYFPVSWCWNSFDKLEPGDKNSSHGTHVTGTSLGMDTLTNDTIGVAFNARFIAADPIAEDLTGIKPIEVLIGAFEFALNPDGNVSTAADVPDVITNSWGIPFYEPSLCNAPIIEDMFVALDAAGIAVEFSAGNEGPNPETISLPQYISLDTINIFTVGAVSATNEAGPFNITDFSSRGPTKCITADGNSPLKIKPEVVAPGFQVRSAVNQDQYAYYSGTSMAGPHVSGSVALLKEAFPMLGGREILNALYQTASDLGQPGEDNTYGRGLINLKAAFDYLSAQHTPVPPNNSKFDLAIEKILFPTSACTGIGAVSVILKNRGSENIKATKLLLRNNLSQVFEKNLSILLAPNQKDTVLIAGIDLKTRSHEFFATAYSDEVITEKDQINNNCTRTLQVSLSKELPYSEDFEQGSITGIDKLLFNPDLQTTWDTIQTGGLPVGKRSAHIRFLGYSPRTGQSDEIRLPNLSAPVGSKKLTFRLDYAYRYRNGFNDSLRIELSSDCGNTWPYHIFSKGGKSLATADTSWNQFKPLKPSDWDSLHFELDSLIGKGPFLFRIVGINRGGSRLYIDNISVYTDQTEINSQQIAVEIFPNPATTQLTVSSITSLPQGELYITDINGRRIYQAVIPNGTQLIQLPITNIAAGLYFISLETNQGKVVRKFIRQ
jgi:hypothetical protein